MAPLGNNELFIIVFKVSLPWGIYLLTLAVNLSNSFVNPILYALRIPEFKEAMVSVCCLKRQVAMSKEGNQRRSNLHLFPCEHKN